MANNIIDISGLSTEIGSILSQYSNTVYDETEKWLKKTAKQTAEDVKAKARQAGFEGGEDYIEGWTYRKKDGKYVVHNKKRPGMAHLLENGHDIVVHGIATGKRTRAFPHISEAEKEMQKYVDDLVKSLGGIK